MNAYLYYDLLTEDRQGRILPWVYHIDGADAILVLAENQEDAEFALSQFGTVDGAEAIVTSEAEMLDLTGGQWPHVVDVHGEAVDDDALNNHFEGLNTSHMANWEKKKAEVASDALEWFESLGGGADVDRIWDEIVGLFENDLALNPDSPFVQEYFSKLDSGDDADDADAQAMFSSWLQGFKGSL